MKRENGKPAKQRIKNWLLQRKNRLRVADTFVIGSIMTLFSAAAGYLGRGGGQGEGGRWMAGH